MKNIVLVFLILLNCCFSNYSFGQAATRSTATQYESLENNFEVRIELLSGQQLSLFQQKSEEQIQDFVDLVDLLTTKEWKPKLKEKLNDQAIHFFTSPSDSLFFLEEKELISITIKNYLKGLKVNSSSKTVLTIHESTPPLLEEDIYTWTLNFEVKKQNTSVRNFTANFILQQEEKKFGKKKKKVWDVKIKEVKEISK